MYLLQINFEFFRLLILKVKRFIFLDNPVLLSDILTFNSTKIRGDSFILAALLIT